MIFLQWELVLSGRKTQTRRLWHDTDYTWIGGHIGEERQWQPVYTQICQQNGRNRFAFGQLLPITPRRGQKAIRDADGNIERVVIAQLRRERLQAITEADAIAEGVNSVAEYRQLWDSINGKTKGARWDDNPFVAVITFRLVTPAVKQGGD